MYIEETPVEITAKARSVRYEWTPRNVYTTKGLSHIGLCWCSWLIRRKLLLKNNTPVHLQFARDQGYKQEYYWKHGFWLDKTKIELWFKWDSIWGKESLHSSMRLLSQLWNMMLVVSWFRPVLLHMAQDITDGTKNADLYQWIQREKARTSVHEPKLKRILFMEEDNDPKHTSPCAKE